MRIIIRTSNSKLVRIDEILSIYEAKEKAKLMGSISRTYGLNWVIFCEHI